MWGWEVRIDGSIHLCVDGLLVCDWSNQGQSSCRCSGRLRGWKIAHRRTSLPSWLFLDSSWPLNGVWSSVSCDVKKYIWKVKPQPVFWIMLKLESQSLPLLSRMKCHEEIFLSDSFIGITPMPRWWSGLPRSTAVMTPLWYQCSRHLGYFWTKSENSCTLWTRYSAKWKLNVKM